MSSVTVRYWAAVRAAAGRSEDTVEADTVAEALAAVHALHPGPAFGRLLDVCSLLVDGAPVGGRDRAHVHLAEGASVEVLPPFAGG